LAHQRAQKSNTQANMEILDVRAGFASLLFVFLWENRAAIAADSTG
jgi:hypothetical protein